LPAKIDWNGLAEYMNYSSVKEMLESEIAKEAHAKFVGHNVTSFAKKLGVSTVSLAKKMKEVGVEAPPKGMKYYFFPERFGYSSEKAMFQCWRFDEGKSPEEIQDLLKEKITELPVRRQNVIKRLKEYKCFNGIERQYIYHKDGTWSWRKLCPICGGATVRKPNNERGYAGSWCTRCDWETPQNRKEDIYVPSPEVL